MVLQGVAYLEAKAAEEGVIATGSGLLCVRGVLCVRRSRRRRVWFFVCGGVACGFSFAAVSRVFSSARPTALSARGAW